MLTKGRKAIAENMKKEFNRVEKLQGKYKMHLIKGESIVYENGSFGSYYHTPNLMDQDVSWSTKEKMLEKALSYANSFAKLQEKNEWLFDMPRFEKTE
jgi:hypothetical protein